MTDDRMLQTEIASLLLDCLNVEVSSFDEDLIEGGLLDSLKIVEMLVELESRFVVTIPFEDLELDSFRSVVSIARLIATLYASIEVVSSPISAASGAMGLPVAD